MKWFTNCKCIEDLKQTFHKLCFKYHPDTSGEDTLEIMKEINSEFDTMHKALKNIHRSAKGDVYTAKKETVETAEEFRHIIENLIHMQGVKIEIIGRWIWVSGATMPYRLDLKKLKFYWNSAKKAWSWHKPEDAATTKGKYSMAEIRDFFGSAEVETRIPQMA